MSGSGVRKNLIIIFKDCLLGGSHVGGVTSFSVRLAEAAGYKVLLVTHLDISTHMKLVTRWVLLRLSALYCTVEP